MTMPQPKTSTPTPKQRLALARRALRAAEMKVLQGNADEFAARLASCTPAADFIRKDGSVEAVVLFGTWLRDIDAGEEGPAICYRVGNSAPAVTLLHNVTDDEQQPDIAAGDRVRLLKIGARRHSFLGTLKPACKRRPIDWLSAWRKANAPNVHAMPAAYGYA